MKPWMRYVAIGIPLYLLFLAVQFPAALAYRFAAEPLSRAVPGLKLGGIEGSVWSGRAGMLAYRRVALGQASWELSPLALLLGKATLSALLQRQDGYLQSGLSMPLAGGGIALSAVEGRIPVTELLHLGRPLPLVLDGMVSMNLSEVRMDDAGRIVTAEGTVIWHQAAMTAPQALVFGDLQIVLRTEEEGSVVGDISDRGGPLRLEGTLQLTSDGLYRVNGILAAAPDAPPALAQTLGLLGKPDAQGRYRLNYSGRL